MQVAAIILAAIVLVGLVLYIHHRLTGGDAPEMTDAATPSDNNQTDDNACCGLHITCERDSLLAGVSDKIVYYDDEELDAYSGRSADSYSDAEIEQFRDVLLTLLPDDIAGWARSIQLRGIELPGCVRDELFLIISEARASRSHA